MQHKLYERAQRGERGAVQKLNRFVFLLCSHSVRNLIVHIHRNHKTQGNTIWKEKRMVTVQMPKPVRTVINNDS